MQFESIRSSSLRIARLAVALAVFVHPGWALAADFRDASWGMTLKEITALHPGELPADRRIGYIAFDAKLATLDVLVFYRFDERGRLFQAGYEVNTDGVTNQQTIADYDRLNALLRRRYPETMEPEQIWRNRLFESKPDKWGQAVMSGHMTYLWKHKAGQTGIEHSLSGNRREITHVISYTEMIEQIDADALDQL